MWLYIRNWHEENCHLSARTLHLAACEDCQIFMNNRDRRINIISEACNKGHPCRVFDTDERLTSVASTIPSRSIQQKIKTTQIPRISREVIRISFRRHKKAFMRKLPATPKSRKDKGNSFRCVTNKNETKLGLEYGITPKSNFVYMTNMSRT